MENKNQDISESEINNFFDNLIEDKETRLERKAKRGDTEAMYQLGIICERKKQELIAICWYSKAGDAWMNPHAESQYRLGCIYLKKQEYEDAFYWYERAAEQDHAEAQMELARLYDDGSGAEQSYKKANYWYEMAKEKGINL